MFSILTSAGARNDGTMRTWLLTSGVARFGLIMRAQPGGAFAFFGGGDEGLHLGKGDGGVLLDEVAVGEANCGLR